MWPSLLTRKHNRSMSYIVTWSKFRFDDNVTQNEWMFSWGNKDKISDLGEKRQKRHFIVELATLYMCVFSTFLVCVFLYICFAFIGSWESKLSNSIWHDHTLKLTRWPIFSLLCFIKSGKLAASSQQVNIVSSKTSFSVKWQSTVSVSISYSGNLQSKESDSSIAQISTLHFS